MSKIILFSSLGGSSAYIGALLPFLPSDQCILVAEGVGAQWFEDHNIKVDLDLRHDSIEWESFFMEVKPRVVFSVPQWKHCIEKEIISIALNNSIRTICGVDNWMAFRERYSRTDDKGIVEPDIYLPDAIITNDAVASDMAVQAGLPETILHDFGNPILDQLATNEVSLSSREEWLQQLGLPDKRIIGFLAEDYVIDFPKGSDWYQGFDEYDVLDAICTEMPTNSHLLIKLHPAEPDQKYERYAQATQIKQTPLHPMFIHSDIIIGMSSYALIEASMFRNNVLSYRPNERKIFLGNEIGVTHKISTRDELRQLLRDSNSVNNSSFASQHIGARSRIAQFIAGNY